MNNSSNYKLTDIVKYPIITDKATRILENNQYSFIVTPDANKIAIKTALEYLFNIKIIKINTLQLPKKKKRIGKYIGWKSHYKKAIVTLQQGYSINLFAEN